VIVEADDKASPELDQLKRKSDEVLGKGETDLSGLPVRGSLP